MVSASPLTRSSYHAGDDFARLRAAGGAQFAKGLADGRALLRLPQCKMRHSGLPALVYEEPAAGLDESGNPRALNRIGKDFCVIDDRHFFVRTVFEIPILGQALPLEWGVWGSLSQANFQRYRETFDDTDQRKLGGMFSFSRMSSAAIRATSACAAIRFPKTIAASRSRRSRRIRIIPCDTYQINGITVERAIELAMPVLHPQGRA